MLCNKLVPEGSYTLLVASQERYCLFLKLYLVWRKVHSTGICVIKRGENDHVNTYRYYVSCTFPRDTYSGLIITQTNKIIKIFYGMCLPVYIHSWRGLSTKTYYVYCRTAVTLGLRKCIVPFLISRM